MVSIKDILQASAHTGLPRLLKSIYTIDILARADKNKQSNSLFRPHHCNTVSVDYTKLYVFHQWTLGQVKVQFRDL